jgi:5,10-methenyltetrahydrofolate synthetase
MCFMECLMVRHGPASVKPALRDRIGGGQAMSTKAPLRKHYRQLRRNLPAEERLRRSGEIQKRAEALPFFSRARTVHSYLSMAEEVETQPLLQKTLDAGKTACVPWIDPRTNRLMACALDSLVVPMHRDAMGIEAPRHCRAFRPEDIDIAFIPGLAFDAEGGRLGFGKGYYDGFLRGTRMVKVGLAFEEQISSEALPMGAGDVFMDFVLTEKSLHARGNGADVFLLPFEQEALLRRARAAIAARLEGRSLPADKAAENLPDAPLGLFVTLTLEGELRGCIGFIENRRPLARMAEEAAVLAATQDPRFPPMTPGELAQSEIEISMLSSARRARPEEVRVGRHGLIVSAQGVRGLLLPQVAVEHAMTREEFLGACCRKAGLPENAWKTEGVLKVETFTAQVFNEVHESS